MICFLPLAMGIIINTVIWGGGGGGETNYYPFMLQSRLQQMKYHALFVIFEKVTKFEIVVCCKF